VVVATGRDAERLEATRQSLIPGPHCVFSAELTDESSLDDLVSCLPALQGVVHCAGYGKVLPFKFISSKEIQLIQRVNYDAPILLTQRLLKKKLIPNGGAIVFVASISALTGAKGYGLYSGSKGALVAMSRSLALELAPQKIRVNCVAPGMVHTPMASEAEAAISTPAMQEHERAYPLGFGEPDDVASPVAFLLSSASRWITGECLVLDGGYSAH
jgi:NAD(P)-dependent dehydrogenase (short-subunit alcohol dehydrogenase family)